MTQTTANRYGVIGRPRTHNQPEAIQQGQGQDSKDCSLFSFDITSLRKRSPLQHIRTLKAPQPFRYGDESTSLWLEGRALRSRSTSPDIMSMLPVCERPEFSMSPSLEELKCMTERQLAAVRGFRVTHSRFGFVEWAEPVDVRYLQLDRLIRFQQGGVFFATQDVSLSEQFQRLNQSAMVVLFNCWPTDDEAKLSGSEFQRNMVLDRYRKTLVKLCIDHDAQFVSYNASNGSWKFNVKRFMSDRQLRKQRMGA